MSRTFILAKPDKRQIVTWRLPRWCLRLLLAVTGWRAEPLVTFDHEHEWVPWHEIWLGQDYVLGDKEFSNGRGCRICQLAEPLA